MISAWTKHVKDPAEREQLEKSLRHSKWVLDQLKVLLDNIEVDVERQEISPRSYDSPNWEFRQAHSNGFRQCLHLVKKLINLDQQETK